MESDPETPGIRGRVRWANVARALALVAVAALVVAWPRLRAPAPEVPRGAAVPVRQAPAPAGPVTTSEPEPAPTAEPDPEPARTAPPARTPRRRSAKQPRRRMTARTATAPAPAAVPAPTPPPPAPAPWRAPSREFGVE
jgi:outer membrane biosynthesis protein TonB